MLASPREPEEALPGEGPLNRNTTLGRKEQTNRVSF